jgi:hypothetical protein
MKKFLICMMLSVVAAVGCAAGQKSYVNVVADHIYSSVYQEIYLTGDVPAGIKTHYDGYGSNAMTVGVLLNLLANEGFTIEQMSCAAEGEVIILSRPSSSDTDAVQHIAIDDQDVHEVARYNLQGMSVDEHEKGIQIVVYSNYTTKTLIIE